jgi:hypothetical protein
VVSAYAVGGIAAFHASGLDIPVQPSFAIGAGYPIEVGPVALDLGARVSLSPIQYDTQMETKSALLAGIRVTAGVTYKVTPRIGLRGDLGVGVAMLSGLAEGNPFTDSRQAASFTMPSLRFGVSADYAITRNLIVTLAPMSVGLTLVPEDLFIGSLTELDVLLGLGYQM